MRVVTNAALSVEEARSPHTVLDGCEDSHHFTEPVTRHSMQAAMRVARVEADQHPGQTFVIYEDLTLASIVATVVRTSEGRSVWLRDDVR